MAFDGYNISKTSFLKLEQCPKSFFLYKKHPWLKDKIDVDKQITFSRGHAIGGFAQELFPGGTDVSKMAKSTEEAVKLTGELIASKTKTIYEACFIFDKILIYVDVLHFSDDKYYAFEVKSSLKISEIYLIDACMQYYVLKNSLQNLEDFYLVTINGDYILTGEIDPKQFFKKRSIKKDGEKNLIYFQEKIREGNLLLEKNSIPNVGIGKHCFRPYSCDFYGTCWKNEDRPNSIFHLPLINKDQLFEWNERGIKTVDQLNDSQMQNEQSLTLKHSFVKNEPVVILSKIEEVISGIKHPVAALDMEIWSAAVPALQGTRPFQQIPFLFCLNGEDKQTFYLSEYTEDERKQFALELISQTKEFNSLLVYDKTMEDQVINGLINLFEDLAPELNAVRKKMVDLSVIIKNFYYYDPSFKNNFTLKTVCEALRLDVSFDKIRSGLEAMNYFERFRLETNALEKANLRQELIDYCSSDTKATYLFYRFLNQVISAGK